LRKEADLILTVIDRVYKIAFYGGGVDTPHVLNLTSREEVKKEGSRNLI